MVVLNTAQAVKYINENLPASKTRSYDSFLRDVRAGKVAHFANGKQYGTRYDFTQADLDNYIKALVQPKGERIEIDAT